MRTILVSLFLLAIIFEVPSLRGGEPEYQLEQLIDCKIDRGFISGCKIASQAHTAIKKV